MTASQVINSESNVQAVLNMKRWNLFHAELISRDLAQRDMVQSGISSSIYKRFSYSMQKS